MRLLDRSRPPRSVAARLQAASAWAFDWDGTLIDSIGRTHATYRQLFGEFGIPFDEVPHSKPDPAPVQLAARYLRLQPADLVLVGDADDDMAMARRAGATAVGVLTGAAERGRLPKWAPPPPPPPPPEGGRPMSARPTPPRLARAVVIADGDVPARPALDAAWPGWSEGRGLVIAADGGALGATRLRLPPGPPAGGPASSVPPAGRRPPPP